MGTEALWVPAVIAAVGAGVQAKETHDVAKEQDEAAAQGIRTQAGRQREADARVAQEVNKIGQSSPEDSQREATDAFMQQLKRTRSQAHGGVGSVGAVSDAYGTDSANASSAIDEYGANRAGVLGRINAPGLQRTAENVSRLRATSELGQIGRNAAGDQFLTQLRMGQIRANPWMMAGGQMMQSYGQGMAASSGAGAGASKVPKGGTSYGGTFTGSTRGFA